MPSHKKINHSRNISRKKKGSKRSHKNVRKKKQFVSLSQFENILFGGTTAKEKWQKAIKKVMTKQNIISSFQYHQSQSLQIPAKSTHPILSRSLMEPLRETGLSKSILSKQCDIWSFGCTMIEMYQYGELPYKHPIDLSNNDVNNIIFVFLAGKYADINTGEKSLELKIAEAKKILKEDKMKYMKDKKFNELEIPEEKRESQKEKAFMDLIYSEHPNINDPLAEIFGNSFILENEKFNFESIQKLLKGKKETLGEDELSKKVSDNFSWGVQLETAPGTNTHKVVSMNYENNNENNDTIELEKNEFLPGMEPRMKPKRKWGFLLKRGQKDKAYVKPADLQGNTTNIDLYDLNANQGGGGDFDPNTQYNYENYNSNMNSSDGFFTYLRENKNKKIQYDKTHVGSGNFGNVFKYTVGDNSNFTFMTKTPAELDIIDFYKECYVAQKLLEGNYDIKKKNIVLFYGYSNTGIPFFPDEKIDRKTIFLQYCNKGDLKNYLETLKETDTFTYKVFFEYCTQICDGMSYLHSKGILHLDLACRNILCHQEKEEDSMTLKICDFGLSLFVGEEHQEMINFLNNASSLPIKLRELLNVTGKEAKASNAVNEFDIDKENAKIKLQELLSDTKTADEVRDAISSFKKNMLPMLKRIENIHSRHDGSEDPDQIKLGFGGLTTSNLGGGARDAIKAKEKFIDMMGPKVYKSYITTLYNQAKQQYLSGGFQTVRKNSKKVVGAKGRGIKVGGAKGKKGYVRHNKSVVKLKKKTRKYIKKKTHKKKA